jgi:uncharacterized protein (DUF58 family)
MVRREEQPWQSRAAVLLDTRAAAHRGDGPGSSFEWAVSAAASVASHLGHNGYSLRLMTDSGLDISAGSGGVAQGLLLDHLADVQASRVRALAATVNQLRHGGNEGLAVAVLGMLQPDDAQLLARARSGSMTGIAVLIDAASWIGLSTRLRAEAETSYDKTVRVLLAGGWRVLEAHHGGVLPRLWPHAGVRADRTSAAARVAAR